MEPNYTQMKRWLLLLLAAVADGGVDSAIGIAADAKQRKRRACANGGPR